RRSPEIHLPHGNWELGHGLYGSHAAVMEGDYSIINNLRLFSQIYTGFQLLSFTTGHGMPLPQMVPADLDDRLAKLAASPSGEVSIYLQTTAQLPEALHVTPPNVFGEVGWVVNGKIINHDTNAYLERIALLAASGKLWELRRKTLRPRILEIGSGFG